MKKIVILGAGMAGFGADYFLREKEYTPVIFEKQDYYGGKASSFKKKGFTFDTGPHISFTKDEKIQHLFAESVKNNYETLQVEVNNYWKGYWVKHPAQANLYGLPTDLVVTILKEFIESKNDENKSATNFKDWLYKSFGKTFAETFPMKYAMKFHTTDASNMSVDWVGPRLYQPKMEEILFGALSPKTKQLHYISHFRYPKDGGFVKYLDSFKEKSDLKLNHELIEVDVNQKLLKFENGYVFNYDHLISSIPLPVLIPRITKVPKEVLDASNKLACSKCVIVNLGVNRRDISKIMWSYFYDEEIIFTRLSFPHMQASSNAPDGYGSIQAEIYFSNKYKPLTCNPNEFIEQTITDLNKCGLLNENDEIVYKEARLISFANVIFDHDRKDSLEIVHSYLDEVGIKYCGRYGEWKYIWTDESFKSGMKAANQIIEEIEND